MALQGQGLVDDSEEGQDYITDSAIDFGPLPAFATPPTCITRQDTPSPTTRDLSLSEDQIHAALAQQSLSDALKEPTIGLLLAKKNFLCEEDLGPGRLLDVAAYPPIFVTGVLQLPGTLLTALGYENKSELEMVRCMTPGRSFHVGDVSRGPRTQFRVGADDSASEMSGMVILGRGRDNRRALDIWYGEAYMRVGLVVEICMQRWMKRRVTATTWVRTILTGLHIYKDILASSCELDHSTNSSEVDGNLISGVGDELSEPSSDELDPSAQWWGAIDEDALTVEGASSVFHGSMFSASNDEQCSQEHHSVEW